MEKTSKLQAEIAKRVQECLKELGFEAEANVSQHEAIVFARKESEGKCIRVVTHITDREVKPANAGSLAFETARTRVQQMAIRPTLATQTATRFVPEGSDQGPCD